MDLLKELLSKQKTPAAAPAATAPPAVATSGTPDVLASLFGAAAMSTPKPTPPSAVTAAAIAAAPISPPSVQRTDDAARSALLSMMCGGSPALSSPATAPAASAAEGSTTTLSTAAAHDPLDVEMDKISLITTEVARHKGGLVALSGDYMCYVIRGGKIRVINRRTAERKLLKGHASSSTTVIDIRFFSNVAYNVVASVGDDGLAMIRRLGEKEDGKIMHETLLQLFHPGAGEVDAEGNAVTFSRIVWHPTNMCIFAVVDGSDVVVVDGASFGLGGFPPAGGDSGAAEDEGIVVEPESFEEDEGFVVCRGHSGAVNDAVFIDAGARLLSASNDGTVRMWQLGGSGAKMAQCLLTLVAHGGAPVWSVLSLGASPYANSCSCVFFYVPLHFTRILLTV